MPTDGETEIFNNIEFNTVENLNNNVIGAISWVEVSKKLFDIINGNDK